MPCLDLLRYGLDLSNSTNMNIESNLDKTPSINTYLEQDTLMKEHSHDEHTFSLGSTLGQKVGEAIALAYHNLNPNLSFRSNSKTIILKVEAQTEINY